MTKEEKQRVQKIKERLRELRKEKSQKQGKTYTQDNLAEEIFVDRSDISRWENPKNDTLPDGMKYYERLADVYGVSIDYILCRDNARNITNGKITQLTGLSEHAIELLKFLKSKSGKGDGVMSFGPEIDNYSWKNVEMINYVFDIWYEKLEDMKKEPKRPLASVFAKMYEYIHASDLTYIHASKEGTSLFGEVNYQYKEEGLEYDKVLFFDSSTHLTLGLDNPTQLLQASEMQNIQKWLMDEAEKHNKKEDGK